jgi:mono/diheme cytochrome c family protein
MAFSPQTGLVYIPANEIGSPFIPDENFSWRQQSANLGVDVDKMTMPADRATVNAVKAGLQGRIVAWDPVKRRPAWTVDLGAPWNGGMLATAGGYDARTGEKVWSFPAQSGIVAPPISYELGGKQYVSIVVGWGGTYPLLLGELARKSNDRPNTSRVLTFTLDGTVQLPAEPVLDRVATRVPPPFGTPAQIARGRAIFARTCAGCHGDGVRSGGVIPDLRWSAMNGNARAWRTVVIDGVLTDNGMVSFRDDLTPDDAEAVRAYVVYRGNEDRAD